MIKSKPNINTFKNNPDDFLEGGEADKAIIKKRDSVRKDTSIDSLASTQQNFKPEPTVQKLFRLRWDIANALKINAAKESARTGKRVTETDIVQNLLKKYYNID